MSEYLSNEQVEELLPPLEEFLVDIEQILSRFSSEESVIQPVRTQIISPKHNSMFFSMPCYLVKEDIYCLKTIGAGTEPQIKKDETEEHQPIIVNVNVTLYHGQSVQPLIIMNGEDLTLKRTTIASAVATKYLVNGKPKVLTIMGSGRLSKCHLEIFNNIYQFSEIRVWNYRSESGIRLVNEFKGKIQAKIIYVEDGKKAVDNADIICIATFSQTPVLNLNWVKPGAHINALGACRPTAMELESINQAVVYVDSRKAAVVESGDIIQSKVEIYAEIGEVVNGNKQAFPQKTTVFKSMGIALEDAITAYRVYNNWKARKLTGN